MSISEATRRRAAPALMALPWAACAGALVVVVVGAWIKLDAGALNTPAGPLGTPLAPFVGFWGPQVDPLAIISIVAFAGALAVAPAILTRVGAGLPFSGVLYALTVVLGLGVNLAHVGLRGWYAVFAVGRNGSVEGKHEYLTGLQYLSHGVGSYLRHFGSLFSVLPTHVKGNPPGPLIALHLLGIHTAAGLAALCIGVGALTAPLAYDLGRTVGGEERGRVAGMLTAFAPSLLLFGVTSTDYAYAALGLAAACLLVRPGRGALVAGGVMVAFGSFFSWLLFAMPAWAGLLQLRRRGWRVAVSIACASVVTVVAFNGGLALAYGYDPFSALRATERVYHDGIAATRPYSFWIVGSPAAWAVMLGLPVVWLSLRALVEGDAVALSLWALVVAASVLGFTKAETERIWLPFVPLACVAAAAAVPPSRLRPVLLALACQALALELLFFTVW